MRMTPEVDLSAREINNMDLETSHSPGKANVFHSHRLDHNPSKLPAFRFADLQRPNLGAVGVASPSLLSQGLESAPTSSNASHATEQGTLLPQPEGNSNFTTPTAFTPSSPKRRPATSPGESVTPLTASYFNNAPSHSTSNYVPKPQDRRFRRAPASHSSNGIETFTGPPPALSTQRSFAAEPARTTNNSTSEWALAQQQLAYQSLQYQESSIDNARSTSTKSHPRGASKSLDESILSRPLIPPIRSFRSSTTRPTLEMNGGSFHRFGAADEQEDDRDRTLRALEGLSDEEHNEQTSVRSMEQDGVRQTNATTEDLFLKLAQDDLTSQAGDEGRLKRADNGRSRIAFGSHRQSLPPVRPSHRQPNVQPVPRLGSDLRRAPSSSHPQDKDFSVQQRPDRVAYHPSSLDSHTSSSAHPRSELNRSRYVPSAAQSSPTSPRGSQHTYDSQLSYAPRQSKPEQSFRLATRTNSYRQSNLSYSTPRVYNSSPLVARTMEVDDGPETPRAAEGTESTTSTTAPSTVWDELDDLKSRIRKLELTGKLPATSGAAVSHASGERPPTATTTATTMSTSPKGGRGHSMSPTYSNGIGTAAGETHPLLQSALANSKLLLSPEVYKALEAAASDALVIAAVMGSVGQSGLMSGAQSVIGSSVATVTDRQLRRKADSMCRSLTELCLALSDDSQLQAVSQALIRPGSRDKEHQNGASNSPQRVTSSSVDGLSRVKSSPRALSRLEARRSSLLANSSLPSPRYAPSEIAAPTQAAMAGRRTSMLLRNRRAGTEELDQDDEEGRFRAPSRAATEIGRLRNSTREYSSQLPLPDVRTPSAASNLPVRRHYVSTSLNSGLSPSTTMPNLAARKYLDRSTPERDTSSVIGRLAEDRGQRIAGLDGMGLGRTGSVDRRRLGNNNTTEKSTAVPIGAYQV